MSLLSITGGITGGGSIPVAAAFLTGVLCGALAMALACFAWILANMPPGPASPARPIDCFTNPELFTPADAISSLRRMGDGMPETINVTDAMAIADLPEILRVHVMGLVRQAYFAGFEAAAECADSDHRSGVAWRYVPEYSTSCAGIWLTENARELLNIEVGCEIDAIYSPDVPKEKR